MSELDITIPSYHHPFPLVLGDTFLSSQPEDAQNSVKFLITFKKKLLKLIMALFDLTME